jgi:hypothetical protein
LQLQGAAFAGQSIVCATCHHFSFLRDADNPQVLNMAVNSWLQSVLGEQQAAVQHTACIDVMLLSFALGGKPACALGVQLLCLDVPNLCCCCEAGQGTPVPGTAANGAQHTAYAAAGSDVGLLPV